jgi:hypothetical protein
MPPDVSHPPYVEYARARRESAGSGPEKIRAEIMRRLTKRQAETAKGFGNPVR